jgi:hypothetical protein
MIKVTIPRMIICVCVAQMGQKRNVGGVLVRKPEEKRQL